MKKIYFRVDVNEIIATGHIMRCLSIAEAVTNQGCEPVFILADNTGQELVESKGYETIILNSQWDELETEIDKLISIIKDKSVPFLILDSYSVTDRYLEIISEYTKVYYIDDLGNIEFPVAGIICYANYYEKFKYKERFSGTETKLILGCDYVPLRKVFRDLPQKEIRDSIERVLVLSGGTDRYHILEKILQELIELGDIRVDVICGRLNDEYNQITNSYRKANNIRILRSVDNIEEYMLGADIAISAGGTTLYELCACGTPTITYSLADNQLDNVKKFKEDGLMPYLGDVRYNDLTADLGAVLGRYKDSKMRTQISHRLMTIVDGRGSERIVESIFEIE